MNSRDFDNGSLIAFLIIASLLIFTFWVSHSLGADFKTTFDAILQTGLPMVIAGILCWGFEIEILLITPAFFVMVWPIWWPVLDSIANQGNNSLEFLLPSNIWYTSDWFKYGIETILLSWLVYTIINRWRRF